MNFPAATGEKGENILSDEFNMGSFSIVILEDMKSKDVIALEKKIREIDNVEKVVSANDVIGTSIPKEMLPAEIKDNTVASTACGLRHKKPPPSAE